MHCDCNDNEQDCFLLNYYSIAEHPIRSCAITEKSNIQK